VRCAGQTIQSAVKSQTLNPGWYETLTLDVTLPVFEKDVDKIHYLRLSFNFYHYLPLFTIIYQFFSFFIHYLSIFIFIK